MVTNLLPPTIPDHLFADIDTSLEDHVERRFQPWVVRELHPFLNNINCLSHLQAARKGWKSRTRAEEAFGTFKADPHHWYSFNHGGRNEAQFNVGMFPTHFRVGLGFEFTEKRGGNPSDVTLAYTMFRNLTAGSGEFAAFVRDNHIEIEFHPNRLGQLGIVGTTEVLTWEPPASPSIEWIFFGRLLRRGTDRDVLEDGDRFGAVLTNVLCGFVPFWKRTMESIAEF